LGKTHLAALSAPQVQSLRSQKLAVGLSPSTVKYVHALLHHAFAVVALRAHKTRLALDREAAESAWVEWNVVFPPMRGTPLDPKNVMHRCQAFLFKAGFRRMWFHALCHACDSLFLAQGESPRTIMEIPGHSQFCITMDIYSHVIPSITREAARPHRPAARRRRVKPRRVATLIPLMANGGSITTTKVSTPT
jgi:integrase